MEINQDSYLHNNILVLSNEHDQDNIAILSWNWKKIGELICFCWEVLHMLMVDCVVCWWNTFSIDICPKTKIDLMHIWQLCQKRKKKEKEKKKAKMLNWFPNFFQISFQSFNFTFVHFSPLNFKFFQLMHFN